MSNATVWGTHHRRRLVAVIVLTAGLSGLATNAIVQPQDAIASDELEQAIDVIREAYDAAREALERLPRDRFATDPALDASDYDGEAIAAWVERNTRWVPYRGVLRGADGVLLDRKGNSLDRSLLLTRLLEDAGYDARLARGRLSADAVEAALSRAATIAEEVRPAEPVFVDDIVAAAERVSSEAAALANLVGTLPSHVGPEVEEAVADHWWVEARLDDTWTAIDPLLTGPLADMRPDPLERFSPESLPDSLFHEVTVRVVIERWDAGETVEEVPLEHTLRAAEAAYHDFELQFVPYHFEEVPEDGSATAEAEAIAETTEEWLPMLRRGSDTIQQQGFDRQGNLERDPGRVAVARRAEAATSALQGLGSSGASVPTHLTALWLEYRVDVPGREPNIVRREIFDLIGRDRRRDGAIAGLTLDAAAIRERGRSLLGTHRILVSSAEPPPIALEKAMLELWANHGPQIAALVRLAHGAEHDDEILTRAFREPLIALDLLSLATARHLLSPYPSSIYLASPNILTTHFTVEIENPLAVRRAFDVAVNDVGVVGNSAVPAARIRLEQGVLDTMMEAAMLEPDQRSGNPADLFALRGGATGQWRLIDAESPNLLLPHGARARIADALAAGRMVVAPGQLGVDMEPAWWEIDPATGTTLGIGSKGWGPAMEDGAMRGIGAGTVKQGTTKLAFKASCKATVAMLKAAGHIVPLAGGYMRSGYALELLSANC